MVNKFGDGISWENHVDEVFRDHTLSELYYPFNPSSVVYRLIADHLPVREEHDVPVRLLDCGCHVGRWAQLFIDAGFDYTGIDQCHYALMKAREHVPDGVFVESLLWDFDLRDKEYDVAVCVAVLQHNTRDERGKIVDNIRRHLKIGGLFCFTESTIDEKGHGTDTKENWVSLAEDRGFQLIEIRNRDQYLFRAV